MRDEKKHQGAVDESSTEQQFHISDTIYCVVWKIWNHIPSASGSYSRLAVRQNTGGFENF